jgi:hypothetical protein
VAKLQTFRLPRFENRVASGKVFPDYSGGTVPDLHRLPFYALAGTQDLAKPSSTAQSFGCQWDQNNFNFLLTAADQEDESIFGDGRNGQHTTRGT